MNTRGSAWRYGAAQVEEPQVIEVADVMIVHGIPEHIRSDNGPEFVAKDLRKWLGNRNQDAVHRTRLSMGERLLRELQRQVAGRVLEWGNLLLTEGGADASGAWRVEYNTVRPHSSLGYRPPAPQHLPKQKGHGEMENAARFPHPHTPGCGGIRPNRCATLTLHWYKISVRSTSPPELPTASPCYQRLLRWW